MHILYVRPTRVRKIEAHLLTYTVLACPCARSRDDSTQAEALRLAVFFGESVFLGENTFAKTRCCALCLCGVQATTL